MKILGLTQDSDLHCLGRDPGMGRILHAPKGSGNQLVLPTTALRRWVSTLDAYFINRHFISEVSPGVTWRNFHWLGLVRVGHQYFFYYGKKIHHKMHHLNRVKPTILTTCTSLRNRSSVVFPLANLELYTYETVTLQSPLSQLLPSTLLLRLSESDSSEHLLSVDSCSACLSWLAYFS